MHASFNQVQSSTNQATALASQFQFAPTEEKIQPFLLLVFSNIDNFYHVHLMPRIHFSKIILFF